MSCFDLTHAPVATAAHAAATGLVSMSTRPDPEGSGTVEIATRSRPRLRVVWDLQNHGSSRPNHHLFTVQCLVCMCLSLDASPYALCIGLRLQYFLSKAGCGSYSSVAPQENLRVGAAAIPEFARFTPKCAGTNDAAIPPPPRP